MSLRTIRHAIAVSAVLWIPLAATAQEAVEYSDRAEDLFTQGLASFTSGAYRDAGAVFDRIIREYPSCQRVTAAWIMKGKVYIRTDENLDAARTLKAFLVKFPASTYTSDAEAMLGAVYIRIGRYDEALQSYLTSWRALPAPAPDRLWKEIQTALDSIIDQHVAVTSLERMITESRVPAERAYYWLKIAEKELRRDNLVAARSALDTLFFRYPENNLSDRAAAVKAKMTVVSTVRLGALLPLMRNADPSALKEVGNDVAEGVQFAVDEYAKDPSSGVRVTLEMKDTERDPKLAARGVEEFAAEKDITGIIGPVFSTSTSAAAGPANARSIPLVSPTANANGIAATGQFTFQANPDYDMRGRAMAHFAVDIRGFRKLAVLAPSDTYARSMAEAFIAEAARLGAKIVAASWYQHGTSDLKPQLAEIRRAGILQSEEPSISFAGKMKSEDLMRFAQLGVPVKRIDSLMSRGSTVPVSWLLGPLSREAVDSLGINVVYDESKVDSLQYPATGIEAIYLPISSPEEIGVVSSQIVYFNFQSQMLGSGEWNNFAELNSSKRYCSGIMFESDTYVDSNSVSYTDFQVGYAARFKKSPSRNALYGYDITRLMLSLIRNGATSRPLLAKALAGTREYQGLHSKIGFSSGRVNSWLSVLQYKADAIQKVDEVRGESDVEAARAGERPGR